MCSEWEREANNLNVPANTGPRPRNLTTSLCQLVCKLEICTVKGVFYFWGTNFDYIIDYYDSLHNTDALLANTMVMFKCHQYRAPKIPLANTGINLSYYLYCEISQSDSRTPVNTYQLLLYSMSVVSLNWETLPCYLIYLLYDLQRGCLYGQHSIFVFIWQCLRLIVLCLCNIPALAKMHDVVYWSCRTCKWLSSWDLLSDCLHH